MIEPISKILFTNPRQLVFGAGSLVDFQEEYLKKGKKRLFLFTIEPLLEELSTLIKAFSTAGIKLEVNTSIVGEPTFKEVEGLVAKARKFQADSVVAIGGGSVMDAAKLVAAMIDIDAPVRSFIGKGLLPSRNTFLACLPSTAGTGSEVSPNAIFLDEIDGGKKGVISPYLMPDESYIDPHLTSGVPAQVTAATGIDAFTHCMEAYVNNFAHPMVDLYALEGIKKIAQNLKTAVEDPLNSNAKAAVALGSMYGGMCLGPVNTAAIHALSYPLGSTFKIPHGLSNALLMPYIIDFNKEYAPAKYAEVARALGSTIEGDDLAVATDGVRLMFEWCKELGLPTKLSKIGIGKDDLEEMAKDALKVQRLLQNNVRELSFNDALEIYTKAL